MKITRRIRRQAKQLFHWCSSDGRLDEGRARQVVRYLGSARQRNRIALLWQFRRLVILDHDLHTALVESAVELPPELESWIKTRLVRRYGPGLKIVMATTPELIGGMRIKVSSDVYDGSVRARLAALATNF